MKPNYTDARRRYRTAEESRSPGYLARRFRALQRLQRIRSSRSSVTSIKKAVSK